MCAQKLEFSCYLLTYHADGWIKMLWCVHAPACRVMNPSAVQSGAAWLFTQINPNCTKFKTALHWVLSNKPAQC